MKVETYACDECGAVKQQSNHWVLAWSSERLGRHVGRHVSFVPWLADATDRDSLIHLCGEGCAAKVLSKAIAGWKAK